MLTVFHNNRCGKSRECIALLTEKGVDYTVFNYLSDTITKPYLKGVLKKLQLNPEDIVRKKEPLFIANYKDKNLSDEEWIAVLIANPILIERPIVVADSWAVVARPPEKVLEYIV